MGPPAASRGAAAGLQREERFRTVPARFVAEHDAEVQPGAHLADLVADVAPDPGGAAVVHDDRRAAVQPTRPAADAGADRPEAEPLVDHPPGAGVEVLAV